VLRLSGAQGALEAYNFGAAGVDNGVTVDFKSETDLSGSGNKNGGTKGETYFTGQTKNGFDINVRIHVDLLTGLKGKDLLQTVAHEGSHLQD
jgi:hypothetical protein